MYLLLCDPRCAPVPGVPGDDHIVAEEEDAVQVHGAARQPQEEVFTGVRAQERHLVIQHQLTARDKPSSPCAFDSCRIATTKNTKRYCKSNSIRVTLAGSTSSYVE